jgi:hypothetical protein
MRLRLLRLEGRSRRGEIRHYMMKSRRRMPRRIRMSQIQEPGDPEVVAGVKRSLQRRLLVKEEKQELAECVKKKRYI